MEGLDVASGLDANTYKYTQLIHHFGEQLKYLSVDDDNNKFNRIRFHNLEQLKVSHITTTSLNGIIHSAKNLQQIHLSSIRYADTILQEAASKLVQSCLLLKYISIYEYNEKSLIRLINGIKNGLLKTKDIP